MALCFVKPPPFVRLYRYGFNGKENDNEVKGEGNQQDYGMRIYDPRVGRFLSVDPLTKGFAMLTPYQFASNGPIEAVDLDGLEEESSKKEGFKKSFGKSVLSGKGNTVSYIANNPNHAGYGYSPTMKPSTQADIKRYEVNWSQPLNPTWHIQTFSEDLVYGTSNFIGGIAGGDGEKTAQAIPSLLNAAATIGILKGFLASAKTSIPLRRGIITGDKGVIWGKARAAAAGDMAAEAELRVAKSLRDKGSDIQFCRCKCR